MPNYKRTNRGHDNVVETSRLPCIACWLSIEGAKRLIGLLRSGLLDISPIRPLCFPLTALPEAMEAAAKASKLERVVVQP
jgi:threonine dehydrogenase-like Zn-dependent dehydrogenase